MKPSPQGELNKQDWKEIGRQLLKYTSPLILVFLIALQQNVPLKEALYLVYGAALQVGINFFSKLNDGPKE